MSGIRFEWRSLLTCLVVACGSAGAEELQPAIAEGKAERPAAVGDVRDPCNPKPHDYPYPADPLPPGCPSSTASFVQDGSRRGLTHVAVDAQNNAYAFLRDPLGPYREPVLVKYDPSGTELWRRTFKDTQGRARLSALRVAADGSIYLHISNNCCEVVDFGGGPFYGAALLKLDATGRFVWQKLLGETALSMAVDSSGNIATVNFVRSGLVTLDVRRPDGTEIFSQPTDATVVTFDGSGNIAVAGRTNVGSFLQKLDAAGRPLWVLPIAGSVQFQDIQTTAKGTVVAFGGLSGTTRFGAFPLGHAKLNVPVLLVAEANGAPRWARELATMNALAAMAVEPAGQVTFFYQERGCSAVVEKYNLAGDSLWTRGVNACFLSEETDFVTPWDAVIRPDGRILLGGAFKGTIYSTATPNPTADTASAFIMTVVP